MQIHHLQTLISSPRLTAVRLMTRSICLHWGRPEAPLILQIMATTWLPTNEIDACKGDLVVTITEVIAGNTISTKKSSDFARRFVWTKP
jgi:hypothetical protein